MKQTVEYNSASVVSLTSAFGNSSQQNWEVQECPSAKLRINLQGTMNRITKAG
jgi:hypothetical protein